MTVTREDRATVRDALEALAAFNVLLDGLSHRGITMTLAPRLPPRQGFVATTILKSELVEPL